ncbi:low-complexity tail membrane protein [Synechococcus sp. CCY9202]|uniref:low-complexity tail membrane protein n=1 Tax=Synechococcus sp. CCY9202 TaxID=174698 RepID=UPI002B212267|nr:low-complexity tail membrane protein [Synechococcus sp. CCY9202]MEA5424272.1 low-complexity tail membrane protein [Synechococcus sp. CCY9202]
MNPRSEPLLWLQLLGLPALPLEALVVLLLLGGSDPGPWPALERLLTWAIGVLMPAVLLWRRPPDAFSLLLAQAPLRARRDLQGRISRLQDHPLLRGVLIAGAVVALPLLWWLDGHAALVAGPLALLDADQRLQALLLTMPVLALMLWQWQQVLQSLWLLSRSPAAIEAAAPFSQVELEDRRLCLGLPLLFLPDLAISRPVSGAAPVAAAPAGASELASEEGSPEEGAATEDAAMETPGGEAIEKAVSEQAVPEKTVPEKAVPETAEQGVSTPGDASAPMVAIEPEQRGKDREGPDLDQQID